MLKFNGVSVTLGNKNILKNLDFSLQEGALTVLIGPNGSGKSTLLKAAAGQLPYAGEVFLAKQSLKNQSPKEQAKVRALLPQHLPVAPLSVLELVEMGRTPYRSLGARLTQEDQSLMEKALSTVGLEGLEHRRLKDLSGGERRRAYLAMVLAQDAPFLMLDEPTAYLDMEHARELLQLLRSLQKEQRKTLLVVLHDLNAALEVADEVLILDHGALVFQGTPAACKESGQIEKTFGVERKIKEIYQ